MAKPKARFGKTEQAIEGKPHRYYSRKGGETVVYTVCCDCKLVHMEEFIPKKGYIRVRVWRDDRRTNRLRRGKKVKLA